MWQNNYKAQRNSSCGILDHFFGLPLWLQTSCCGQVLWAYNEAHLNFLESYVQSRLRERLPDDTLGLAQWQSCQSSTPMDKVDAASGKSFTENSTVKTEVVIKVLILLVSEFILPHRESAIAITCKINQILLPLIKLKIN